MTVVDFIREHRLLKGTKIVCREGDCGACTVLIGEMVDGEIVDADKPQVKYHSITSCISPLANANGKHVVTVEGVNLQNRLNVIQQSIKDHYASQCGFCTPGFVMAMTQYCLNPDAMTEQHMLDAISGNICRCTGYVSLINAAKSIVAETQNKGQKMRLEGLVNHHILPSYFLDILSKLKTLNDHPSMVSGQQIVAGGTDLYVQKAEALSLNDDLRFIKNEQGQNVTIDGDQCSISGIATVSDLFENSILNKSLPVLRDHLRLVSSEPIRNMATIAGNLVNASPIADLSVFLLALNAELVIVINDNHRTVALKDFFLAYKKIDLLPGESIAKITFDLPNDNGHFNFQKVSKRKYLDIATVNTAIHIECDASDVIKTVAISVGGVAPVALLLKQTCDFLINKRISIELVKSAVNVMNEEIAPISDVRGSAQYKRFLANQLIKGHFMTLFPELMCFDDLIDKVGVLP